MRLTNSLAAASLALTLLAAPAFAQQQGGAPGAQQIPPEVQAQIQRQQQIQEQIKQKQFAPSHLAIAKDVAVESGIARSFAGVVEQIQAQVRQLAMTRPELKNDLEQILTQMKPELDLQQQQIVNAAARVFAFYLSETELKEIDTFFKTPAGLKYVQTQPQIMDAFVMEFQTWSQQLAEYVMVRTRAELTKRGQKF